MTVANPPVSVPYGEFQSAGRWVYPWGTIASRNLVLNRLTLIPVYNPLGRSFDRVGISVGTASLAGAVARCGVYADANGIPGNLIAEFGTLPADAVANPTLVISQFLPAGIIWYALTVQGDASGQISGPQALGIPGMLRSDQGGNSIGYFMNGVSGALPTGPPTLSGDTAASQPTYALRTA